MAERARAHPPSRTDTMDEEPGAGPGSSPSVADIDEILDEIDEVLEHNAEAFVNNYRQKGGQ